MSNIPNSIKKKGGFLIPRDHRDTNSRYSCCYCSKENILHTSYGIHIFTEHLDDIFDTNTDAGKQNRETLFKKTYLDEPFFFSHKDEDFYGCLGCRGYFKGAKKAELHFSQKKSCFEKHKENILLLRDKYPKDAKSPVKVSIQNKGILIQLISRQLERIRAMERGHKFKDTYDYKKYEKYFNGWNLQDIDEDTLREGWEELEEEEKLIIEENLPLPESPPLLSESPPVPEITPLPPPDDDILPLVIPKPPTQLQMLEELLKDPSLDEAAKAIMKTQVQPPLPPPPVKEEIKKTPWEELWYAHPDTPILELLQIAARKGITPDKHSNLGIIGDTKVKRSAIRKS